MDYTRQNGGGAVFVCLRTFLPRIQTNFWHWSHWCTLNVSNKKLSTIKHFQMPFDTKS